MITKQQIHNMKYYSKYDKNDLLKNVQKRICGDVSKINNEFAFIFYNMLNIEPSIYWNNDVYVQTLANLELTFSTCNNLIIDDDCFEYFLMGYNSYTQLVQTITDLENFNVSPEIKTRLHRLPTYTSIVEGCISNFLRFIVNLVGQSVNKDYTKQSQLGSLLQIIKSNHYSEIDSKINANLRNAINHGKVKFLKINNADSLRFYYSERNISKQTDLKIFEFDKLIDETFDVSSALLLALTTFLNNHTNLIQPSIKKHLEFERCSMELSIPKIECQSIYDTDNDLQLNIEFEVDNVDRDYISELIFLVFSLIYNKYSTYQQYMIFFKNPRMTTGWVRLKNDEVSDMIASSSNIDGVFKKVISRKDYMIFPISNEDIDLNEVKYFTYSNISTDRYKINNIQDASLKDRRRLRANLFVGNTSKKEDIINIIQEGIEKLKNVKNPPSPQMPHKYGTSDADALYINVYRDDTRKDKQLYPSNDNFVCMVDYNLSGETTLKNGGIIESIWNKLYHEKIDNILISWRESKYAQKRTVEKIGRNAPCPCGSGKKYKKCCLK